jgi:N-acetylglutamate synthase-like GNAT family acetyltransferase
MVEETNKGETMEQDKHFDTFQLPPEYQLRITEDFERLVPFFVENELEFSEEEPVSTDIIKGWELIRRSDDFLIGATVLAKRQGEYIVDGIAVDPNFRHLKAGKLLLNQVMKEVKERGGTRIYLVARAPGFFRKMGFDVTPKEEAPHFFECLTCPQYQVGCFPEIMKWEV